jgi:hypothetical protein
MKKWIFKNTSSGHAQAYDEETGRSIAVFYNPPDAWEMEKILEDLNRLEREHPKDRIEIRCNTLENFLEDMEGLRLAIFCQVKVNGPFDHADPLAKAHFQKALDTLAVAGQELKIANYYRMRGQG